MAILPKYAAGHLNTPDGARIPYVRVEGGPIPIVTIPGAGDGLRVVTDAALELAWLYRKRTRECNLLYLSRRDPIPRGYTAEQHAADLIWAAEQLGVGAAFWECNSGGGPIGQWIAIKRPDMVRGLILTSTYHRSNEHSDRVIGMWLEMIRQERWVDLSWSSIEYTFRPQTVARYRLFKPLLPLITKASKYPHRLEYLFEDLLKFDNRPILPRISRPTWVVGGEDDRVLPAEIQREMAALVPNSRLTLFPGYGHGNDQENPAYEVELSRFIKAC